MIRHGVAGWELEDMEWDERDGVAILAYSHPSSTELAFRAVCQPTRRGHVGWEVLALRPQRVLTLG